MSSSLNSSFFSVALSFPSTLGAALIKLDRPGFLPNLELEEMEGKVPEFLGVDGGLDGVDEEAMSPSSDILLKS